TECPPLGGPMTTSARTSAAMAAGRRLKTVSILTRAAANELVECRGRKHDSRHEDGDDDVYRSKSNRSKQALRRRKVDEREMKRRRHGDCGRQRTVGDQIEIAPRHRISPYGQHVRLLRQHDDGEDHRLPRGVSRPVVPVAWNKTHHGNK